MNKKIGLLFMFLILLVISVFAQIRSVSLVSDPIFNTGKDVLLVSIGTLFSDRLQFNSIDASQQELMSKEPSSAKIENSFSMRWKTTEEHTFYSTSLLRQVNNIDIKISDKKIFGWRGDDKNNWINNNCYDFDRDGNVQWKERSQFGLVIQMYCADNGGVAGDILTLSSPRPFWKTDFTLSNGQESITESLSSQGSSGLSKNINNKAFIRFDGLSLFSYPTQVNQIYLFKNPTGWNLFDAIKLTEVVNIYQNDALDYVSKVASGSSSESTQESIISSTISRLKTWTITPDFPPNRVKLDGTNIKLDAVEKISFQNFNVYLNGNWIKITIPAGMPKIVSITANFDKELTATKTGTLKVVVKNVGDDVGTFQIINDCDKSSEFTQTQIISNIGIGDQRTVEFQISSPQLETSSCVQDVCKITTQDTTKLENKVTASYNFEICPRAECSKGEQIAQKDGEIWKVYECDGVKFSILKFVCNVGEEPKTNLLGKYVGCKKSGVEKECVVDNDCKTGEECENNICIPKDNGECKGDIKLAGFTILPDFGTKEANFAQKALGIETVSCMGMFGGVKFAVALLIFIVSLVLLPLVLISLFRSLKVLQKKKDKELRGFIIFLVSLPLSFILYVLTMKLFYIGIGVIVLIFLIRMGIKRLKIL